MSIAAPSLVREEQEVNYLNVDHSLKSWLTTVDHKRIGIMYMLSITFFFVIGGVMATLVRLELLTPAGDLLQSDAYNKALDRKSTRLNSSHIQKSRMPSSA